MRRVTRFLFGPLAVAIITIGIYLLGIQTGEVSAQTTKIAFVVRAEDAPSTGTSGDVVVLTGRVTTTDQVGNCAPAGSYQIQNGVAVDPGDQRATRILGLITVAGTPQSNGTKLGNLTNSGDCAIDGKPYQKLTGTVQQTIQQ